MGGPDDLLPQHLKYLTSENLGEVADNLLNSRSTFFNTIIFAGIVPKNICPYFHGGLLMALSKPNGGIRPIAIA